MTLRKRSWSTLLLLLSRFSCVWLCATAQTAAHQAPPPLGFSRQEHWSGSPFPSPMHESVCAQSCATLFDPVDCSPPGSCVHGIFQARVLEWGAIAFSEQCLKQAQKEIFPVSFLCYISETEPFEISFAIIINITNYKKLILHNTLEIPHMLICMYYSFLW